MAKNEAKLLNEIYQILLEDYGSQGWWPVTVKGHIPSYSGGPKNEKHQLEIIFGAILTQNTNWKNVEKALVNLNKNKLMNIDKVIKIKQTKLARLIRSAGYFNQKAERLKIISRYIKDTHQGKIRQFFGQDANELRKELLAIKGIGPETADSIILYSARKPIFVIDAYTKRIFSRVGVCEESCKYEDLQNKFHENLKHDESVFNEYHALLVELAKRNCRKVPICSTCPIRENCSYYKKKYIKDNE